VRAAASLAHALARESGCALLLPGDRRPLALEGLAGGWAVAHARLALVTGGTTPVLAAGAPRRGAVVYVAARPVRALPPALAALARGPQVVVAPEDPPAAGALFTVAGCAGRALGDGAGRRAAA